MLEGADLSRILIVGTSGSGKSTLGRALAGMLGCPYVEMDAIRWMPGWTLLDNAAFSERLVEAGAGERWVMDGNVRSPAAALWDRLTLVVWLDYPLRVVMGRLVRRTFRRLARKEALWAGNRETVWRALGPDSIVLWALRTHRRNRRIYEGMIEVRVGSGVRFVRLRRAAEAEELIERVRAMAGAR
jgi:adenylate kinase family enzyme